MYEQFKGHNTRETEKNSQKNLQKVSKNIRKKNSKQHKKQTTKKDFSESPNEIKNNITAFYWYIKSNKNNFLVVGPVVSWIQEVLKDHRQEVFLFIIIIFCYFCLDL